MAVQRQTQARTGWREAGGILFLAVCVLLLLSFISYHPEDIPLIQVPARHPPGNFIGTAGAWIAFLVLMTFGVAGFLLPVAVAVLSLYMVFQREGRVWPKACWMGMILIGLVCLAEIQEPMWRPMVEGLSLGSAGGALGLLLADHIFIGLLGKIGTAILATALLLAGIVLLANVHPRSVLAGLRSLAVLLGGKGREALARQKDKRDDRRREKVDEAGRRRRLEKAMARQATDAEPSPSASPPAPAQPEPAPEPAAPPPEKKKPKPQKKPAPEPAPEPEPDFAAKAPEGDFSLPPLSMLEETPPAPKGDFAAQQQAEGQVLEDTLGEFGIEARVTNVERGPVVTRYELLPAPGVRLERITGLSNNIALAMKAESVRVQAPIPGKGVVGIEVPNSKAHLVSIRQILESDSWRNSKAALPLALGQDVGGRELVADLADMPHMLIAGATGSGKTVCMNSILAGLLMSRTPEEMRLMLIDPKIVEFSGYNHLPHLVVPVITDPKKVALGLRWAINEMERRYKLLAKVGVRNIKGFNSRPIVKQEELFADENEDPAEPKEDKNAVPDRLPYIIIIVDELADLMMVAQADVENAIARLAQLSRAVGIHMILATQRPSVNVITGTIKANFPARLAFQVAQKVDSRTILDASGADKLLGKGDMLFLPPGSSKLVRSQGTFTTDQEINRIVEFLKKQGTPEYETEVKEKIESKAPAVPDADEGDEDDMIEKAVEIIRQTRRASTSSLQRRLRIGYTRAARIMDILEERGIIGPPNGADPREILIDLDGDIPQNDDQEPQPDA